MEPPGPRAHSIRGAARSWDLLRLVHEHAIGGWIRTVIAGSVTAASGLVRVTLSGRGISRVAAVLLARGFGRNHSSPAGPGRVPQRLLSDLPCDGWRPVFLREVLARHRDHRFRLLIHISLRPR